MDFLSWRANRLNSEVNDWLDMIGYFTPYNVFLAMALRLRTLLTSATFRPYSGAAREAPILTQEFLEEHGQRHGQTRKHTFSTCQQKYIRSLASILLIKIDV